MSEKPKILMVDDEPNVLSGYRRTLSKWFRVVTAEGGAAGLEALDKQGPFPVVITDMRMPEIDGLEFLRRAGSKHKESVYVMLTGNADQQTAIDAINQGKIFRFLNKPCPGETLAETINACLKQHELIHAEKVLLRDTLAGSIRVLVETIALYKPGLGRAAKGIRADMQTLCAGLGLGADWRISLAASLCLLGPTVSSDADGAAALSDEVLDMHAGAGADLLRHIPRLEEVSQIIARQRESGPLPPALDLSSPEMRVVIGARVLRFAVDYQRELMLSAGDRAIAYERFAESGREYDARLLEAGRALAQEAGGATGRVAHEARSARRSDAAPRDGHRPGHQGEGRHDDPRLRAHTHVGADRAPARVRQDRSDPAGAGGTGRAGRRGAGRGLILRCGRSGEGSRDEVLFDGSVLRASS